MSSQNEMIPHQDNGGPNNEIAFSQISVRFLLEINERCVPIGAFQNNGTFSIQWGVYALARKGSNFQHESVMLSNYDNSYSHLANIRFIHLNIKATETDPIEQ